MAFTIAEPGRERTRHRIVDAATDLLARGGREAVTTRAVAVAAGVQPPTIYRLFGDKERLLEAVAEAGFAAYLSAARDAGPDPDDPVEALCVGWDLAVQFGLRNPALYMLTYNGPAKATSVAFKASMEMLMGRIERLARSGRLKVDEELAALVIHATARGAVLTALSLPQDERTSTLLATLRDAMLAAVTSERPATPEPGATGAARALRASLGEQLPLTAGEQHVLREWLDRLTAGT